MTGSIAGSGWRTAALRAAGPALIALAVLVVLRDWVLPGPVSIGHPDVLPYWLPTHCHLGERLAAGDIPSWSPHLLGGAPFAADPQSGWMHLPAMLLYAIAPCDIALRMFVVLQPVLAAGTEDDVVAVGSESQRSGFADPAARARDQDDLRRRTL